MSYASGVEPLYVDIELDQPDTAPALLVDDEGRLRLNIHADLEAEVILLRGDQVGSWQAPHTGIFTVAEILDALRRG